MSYSVLFIVDEQDLNILGESLKTKKRTLIDRKSKERKDAREAISNIKKKMTIAYEHYRNADEGCSHLMLNEEELEVLMYFCGELEGQTSEKDGKGCVAELKYRIDRELKDIDTSRKIAN